MEEIIIDGVDVAGCRLYDYGICDSEMAEDLNCEKNSDCYYKQLKRLEQENSELKERKDKYYQRTLDLEIVVSEYQQALEEIRELLEPCMANENCSTCEFELCVNKDIINRINEVLND